MEDFDGEIATTGSAEQRISAMGPISSEVVSESTVDDPNVGLITTSTTMTLREVID